MAELLNPNEIFATAFEPKVKNRFILYADGIPSFIIKKTDRPKLSQTAKELGYLDFAEGMSNAGDNFVYKNYFKDMLG